MLEVEVKAHVTDFHSVIRKLSDIGAEKIKTEHQEDVYFNAPHRDFAQTDEALRIREIPSEHGLKIFLTYKGAKMDDKSKTRKEIEVKIENTEKTRQILENLGFYPVKTIKKDRVIYLLDEFIISLDKVYEVGNFVEIETSREEGENFQESLDEIFKIYQKLGIENGFERRSYLELLGIH